MQNVSDFSPFHPETNRTQPSRRDRRPLRRTAVVVAPKFDELHVYSAFEMCLATMNHRDGGHPRFVRLTRDARDLDGVQAHGVDGCARISLSSARETGYAGC